MIQREKGNGKNKIVKLAEAQGMTPLVYVEYVIALHGNLHRASLKLQVAAGALRYWLRKAESEPEKEGQR